MIRLCAVALFLTLMAPSSHALTIAMVLWRGETAAETAFRAELNRLGYHPKIIVFDANQNRAVLAHMLRKEVVPRLDEFDYIYTFGTTATAMAKKTIYGRKPLVFTAVYDPIGASILSADKNMNSMIAGTSHMVPIAMQLANASKYLSTKKHILIPFNPREKNTRFITDMIKDEAARYSWEVFTWRIAPLPKRLDSELKRLRQDAKNDIVFLPSDSYLLSVAPRLLNALNEEGIPTICSVELFVKYGCSVSTISSYDSQGKLAAKIIDSNQRGILLKDIPLQIDNAPRLVVGERMTLPQAVDE
ncbi:hypothetical protein I6L41_02225 [Aeromonas sp. FDAARGOS 1411]|uniref:ABC transporter substrate-binding protein n=1 Tax=Aeromonas TaxID=642 RepID=UPI001C247571|nr:ABC transporter substrate binding protein [Aeromonas sp. FDAARGOS 1411]QWZ95134.1 hypothetical protein I6L41_02225 [Aeromonas sp. FDAARGOS 1411]